ncbi:MAG TPA: radical SAM protein [Phycisphaerales bacterium]|nr:radical SAM protein [Phycisphaerales bacterium]
MINISKLYCDEVTPGDWLRYGKEGSGEREGEIVPKKASERKPIVVWNITRNCNLKCVHCYNDSGAGKKCNDASTEEAKAVLDDLAAFGIPSVLFSGGEPFMRHDLFELIKYATGKGLRAVISTNGTLITPEAAATIKEYGVSYVGISLDGIGEINDKFRGVDGAFDRTVEGIKNCQAVGQRIGLRLTLTKRNVADLEALFDFFEEYGIERACFYHLVPSGRGQVISDDDLTHAQSREAIEMIMARTKAFKEAGRKTDILTVDNHVDGIYLYLKLLKEDPEKAKDIWKLLTWNGGGLNSSGVGIGCLDFNGKVHANQFWGHYDLGDIHDKPFSEIWSNNEEPLLKGLRNRRDYVKGRCRLCKFFDGCGGSLRVRADLHFGDTWAPDPGCYLTDEEIGLDDEKKQELVDSGEVFTMPE